MDGIQALVLGAKLPRLGAWTEERKRLAARYHEALEGLPLRLPKAVNGDHVYHLYVVRTPERDALRVHLDACAVQTGLHYPIPLHRQPALSAYGNGEFPVADAFATSGLSLPLYNGMSDDQQDHVVSSIRAFFRGG